MFTAETPSHEKTNETDDFPFNLLKEKDKGKSPIKNNPCLLNLDIHVGKGKKDTIFVHKNDLPEEIVKSFCKKHSKLKI
jgi:hypothetical protein